VLINAGRHAVVEIDSDQGGAFGLLVG